MNTNSHAPDQGKPGPSPAEKKHWLLLSDSCTRGEHKCNGRRPVYGSIHNTDPNARTCKCECHENTQTR